MHEIITTLLKMASQCEGGVACPRPAPQPPLTNPAPDPLPPAPPTKLMQLTGAAKPGMAAASLPKIAGWVARDRNATWRDVSIEPDDPDSGHYWEYAPSREEQEYLNAKRKFLNSRVARRQSAYDRKVLEYDPEVRRKAMLAGHVGLGAGAATLGGGLGLLGVYARHHKKHPLLGALAGLAGGSLGLGGLALPASGVASYWKAHKYKAGDPEARRELNEALGGMKRPTTAEKRDYEDFRNANKDWHDRIYEWSDDED